MSDDDLEQIRQQIQAERVEAERARAEREAERKRQDEYDQAWNEVLRECNRLRVQPDAEPELAPFEELVHQLAACQRVEWLAEMRDNFRDQIQRGLDTISRERRGELWFVMALLCLAERKPKRKEALKLLNEFRQPALSPWGPGSIADNIRDYFLHHLGAMEQIRKEKLAEMLTAAASVIAELAKNKPAIRRNLQFAAWADGQRLTPAVIRDKWNAEKPDDEIGETTDGYNCVKSGLRAARKFLKELAARGYPISAEQALERLPKD